MSDNLLNIKTFLPFKYHPELIKIFITFTPFGIFAANILSPSVIAYIMYGVIPDVCIYIWLFLHFSVFTGRYLVTKKLKFHLNDEHTETYLKQTFFLTFSTTVLFSLSVWYAFLNNASDFHILTITIIIISLAAGGLATLISIYHLFAIYIIFSIAPIIGIFLYYGGEMFNIFALVLFLTIISIVNAGYRQYTTLKNLVLLEEEKEISNKKIAQLNLELKSKVVNEVSKNREKDKLMLRQSQLAQMGEMLSMIAHQWRQPLAAISATSATLELKASKNQLDNEYMQKKIHAISNYSQHLSSTIDNFRNFFQPNKEKQETSFDEIINAVSLIMETILKNKNIQLVKKLNCHETFRSYPGELKQVILNLISNAEDALVENAVKEPYIQIQTFTYADTCILKVSDNAGGIPEDIIDRIFDPYFSTKESKNGTGLGLYMSKTIIEEHCGGTLNVNNIDEGALFTITLPKTYNETGRHNDQFQTSS